MMLNAETPRNKPSKPPQIDRKFASVYTSCLFTCVTWWSRKNISTFDGWVLKCKSNPSIIYFFIFYHHLIIEMSHFLFCSITHLKIELIWNRCDIFASTQLSLARSISTSYLMAVHAGKQLQFSRKLEASTFLRPLKRPSLNNSRSAVW